MRSRWTIPALCAISIPRLAGRLGLALKAGQDVATLGEIGTEELDRESPLHDGVLRLVDDAHPPLGEHADDPVLGPDDLADSAGPLGARGHD